MKKLIMLVFLLLGVLTTVAQDSLIATNFTDNGKNIYSLKTPRLITLTKDFERSELKITEGSLVIVHGYITKCNLLEVEFIKNSVYRTRELTIISKLDNKTKSEYLLTVVSDRTTEKPLKFILTTIKNNEAGRAYIGKII